MSTEPAARSRSFVRDDDWWSWWGFPGSRPPGPKQKTRGRPKTTPRFSPGKGPLTALQPYGAAYAAKSQSRQAPCPASSNVLPHQTDQPLRKTSSNCLVHTRLRQAFTRWHLAGGFGSPDVLNGPCMLIVAQHGEAVITADSVFHRVSTAEF